MGRLWTSLADFYIRQGMYERARDVYEEGLTTVITVRDFSLIFDTLTQFEETLLTHRMRALAAGEEAEPEQAREGDDGNDFLLKDDDNDIDLRCAWCWQMGAFLHVLPDMPPDVPLDALSLLAWHMNIHDSEGATPHLL